MTDKGRRGFIKQVAVSGAGLGLWLREPVMATPFPTQSQVSLPDVSGWTPSPPDIPFVPRRVARWWIELEDLQWPQKQIRDKIKHRAEGFAAARIDTAISGGCHIRFDFSNYFGQLHGYLANVCEELHQYGIKYIDHYSCNHVERPRNKEDLYKMNRNLRHHVLLFHDPVAAKHAQYEGHFFQDICEVDIRDGSRGYAARYQMEAFCHNNPHFLDMHVKYLKRLLNEVPIDGIEPDDMCDYAGLTTCGCQFCRDRFRRDYGHEIPSFSDKDFWGDTSKPMLFWGNYANPKFRDFIRMKTDGIVDHVKLVKKTVGQLPVMTCCSSTGPITLNSISLDLEKMAPYLDFFMLENVGLNVNSVNWIPKDAEALHQKDIAKQRGDVPAIALSSTIYEKGAYFGWSLSRFWGVANWCNLLNHLLEEDPADAREMEEVIHEWNNWEVDHSNLDFREGEDLQEVRLVSNRYCRDNGWRDEQGHEHWDRLRAWSSLFVKHNVGYRFLRTDELADTEALLSDSTPLVLDGVACVSDAQFQAIGSYLAKGGKAWLALPFGTHDEKGFVRTVPLSNVLLKQHKKNITTINTALNRDSLEQLIQAGQFSPVITQTSGDNRWAVRIRLHNGRPVLHFLNTAMKAIPHGTLKDNSNVAIIGDIASHITDNKLTYELKLPVAAFTGSGAASPETGGQSLPLSVSGKKGNLSVLSIDLTGISVYAVVS